MAAALTAAAVLTLASQYGWDANKAAWIAGKESTNRPDVVSSNGKWVGLYQVDWQLHGLDKEALKDPAYNTAVAYELYQQAGWSPWPVASSYPGGASVGVSADGWLDWAVRVTGPSIKLFAGTNPVLGIFFHSAEGYENGIYSVLNDVSEPMANRTSWHLSNLKDGRLLQHYPLTARCWHATAANQSYVGMEHEGVAGQALTDAQVANDKRVIADVSAWKGWQPRRPGDANDKAATLYEHGEVTRFGGTGSACPSHRIPWDKILKPAQGDEMFTIQSNGGKLTGQQAQGSYLFDTKPLGLPAGKRVRLQVWTSGDAIEFYHGVPDQNNRDAGRVYAPYGIVEVVTDPNGLCYAGPPGANFDVQGLGFYS